jgi:solute carrier family 25 carnitine/acylcarnitine transporter 20/29
MSIDSSFIPFAITFLSGASYGLMTVIVGQPLDTIKTRMQGMSSSSASHILRDLYSTEGIKGLYRGGLPLLIGGSFMRSAQFGFSAKARDFLEESKFPSYKAFNTLDSNVLLAGIAGGIGRAMIEIPTDFLKIRRQVQLDANAKMKFSMLRKNLMDGSIVTFGRNTILFTSFIVYVDLSKQACTAGLIPVFLCNDDSTGLSPFAKGSICANMAWLSCWPFDVVKTQRQSGNVASDIGAIELLKDNMRQGKLFRGLAPGLVRSSIANGSSMVVYESVHSNLSLFFDVQRKDML